MAERLPLFVT